MEAFQKGGCCVGGCDVERAEEIGVLPESTNDFV
jgi:hypothetical protein